jgi:hypothetical protein
MQFLQNDPRPAPKTGAERQRLFRQRHPGYYARIQARNRASANRAAERFIEAMRAAAAQASPPAAPAEASQPASPQTIAGEGNIC